MATGNGVSLDGIRTQNALIVLEWYEAFMAFKSASADLSLVRMKSIDAAALLADLLKKDDPDWLAIGEQNGAVAHQRLQELAKAKWDARNALNDAEEKMRAAKLAFMHAGA